jgi:hypothetical protein
MDYWTSTCDKEVKIVLLVLGLSPIILYQLKGFNLILQITYRIFLLIFSIFIYFTAFVQISNSYEFSKKYKKDSVEFKLSVFTTSVYSTINIVYIILNLTQSLCKIYAKDIVKFMTKLRDVNDELNALKSQIMPKFEECPSTDRFHFVCICSLLLLLITLDIYAANMYCVVPLGISFLFWYSNILCTFTEFSFVVMVKHIGCRFIEIRSMLKILTRGSDMKRSTIIVQETRSTEFLNDKYKIIKSLVNSYR